MKYLLVFLAVIGPVLLAGGVSGGFDSLQIGILKRAEDCPKKAQNGDLLSIHYVGKLTDGKQFDSSREKDKPISIKLGAGMVIVGWEQGLIGMCKGEKRKLKIPSSLGYGKNGSPPSIPPDADLVFEVELMEIMDPALIDEDDYYDDNYEYDDYDDDKRFYAPGEVGDDDYQEEYESQDL